MGLGRFGGGVGVTRWLADQGARVLVTDMAPAEKLEKSLGAISELIERGVVTLRLGEHREEDFTRDAADIVIANPAVPKPWENPFLNAATASGVPITTEIRLLVERLPNRDRTIGITGTAGKSTTAAMVQAILAARLSILPSPPNVRLGGNIGGSILPDLTAVCPNDYVVLELSSAQLFWLGQEIGYAAAEGWSPGCAVVTNLHVNHLDWHGDFDHYAASKRNIVRYQTCPGDGYIFGFDERLQSWRDGYGIGPEMRLKWWSTTGSQVNTPDLDVFPNLPGSHNRMNAMIAWSASRSPDEVSWGSGLEGEASARARDAVAAFPGLPHRLELAGDFAAIRAFNDSKCTTPEAAALAVGAFEEEGECGAGRVHLICGGYDKKIDLAPMVEAAARCKGVYTIGVTGPAIAAAVRAKGGNAVECGELDVAVTRAAEGATPGDVILLSPGCASWDQFENYEQRGERFKALVREAMG